MDPMGPPVQASHSGSFDSNCPATEAKAWDHGREPIIRANRVESLKNMQHNIWIQSSS